MDKDAQERMDKLYAQIDSIRNLRPKTFALVTAPEADIKQRWSAFDELYEEIRQGLIEKGHSPDQVLRNPKAENLAHLPDLTEEQQQRAMRNLVAIAIFVSKHGTSNDAVAFSMLQSELLVPTPPDPDTGRLTLSQQDTVLLFQITKVLRTDMVEDWDTFFKADSVPLAQRKPAFRRLYAVMAGAWMRTSLFPRTMSPDERQKFIILTLMNNVPTDQWGEKDLLQLYEDLLPIEEPDWNDPNLFPPLA
jgi:hypothetical protein